MSTTTITYTIDSETGAIVKINGAWFVSQDPNYSNYITASSNWVDVVFSTTANVVQTTTTAGISGNNSVIINEQIQNLLTQAEDNGTVDLGNKSDAYFGSLTDTAATTIDAGNGNDLISGGAGDDTIDGENGKDTIFGGLGNDVLYGSNGEDSLYGGAGNDILIGGTGADFLSGGSGNDLITGNGGSDYILGGSGNDIIDGSKGSNKIFGEAGDDTIIDTLKDGGPDYLEGGLGYDTLRINLTSSQYAMPKVQEAINAYKNFLLTHSNPSVDHDPTHAMNLPTYSNVNPTAEVFDFNNFLSLSGVMITGGPIHVKALDFEALKVYVDGVLIGSNNPPVAMNDSANTTEDSAAFDISVLANDSDPDMNPLSISSINTAGTLGAVAINGNQINYNPGSVFNHLAANTTHNDTFQYTISDGNGGFATATVTVTVQGLNDAASIAGDADGNVMEDDDLNDSGVLTVSDVDDNQAHFNVVSGQPGDNALGNFSIDADGNWSYALNNSLAAVQALRGDQMLSDSYTFSSVDGTASQMVNITINGKNDAASIAGDADGNVMEDDDLNDSGVLTVSDVDDNQAHFNVVSGQPGDNALGNFSIDADGNWSYALNNSLAAVQALRGDQMLSDSYTFSSVDGTASQMVNITINGKNDAASIEGDADGTVMEDDDLNDSGVLTISDVDNDQAHFNVVTSQLGANGYGDFSIDTDGLWSYVLNNALPAVQALNAGQTLIDSYVFSSVDGTASQTVNVTINGKNDLAPLAFTPNADGAAMFDLYSLGTISGGVGPYTVNVTGSYFQTFSNSLNVVAGVNNRTFGNFPVSVTVTDSTSQSIVSNFNVLVDTLDLSGAYNNLFAGAPNGIYEVFIDNSNIVLVYDAINGNDFNFNINSTPALQIIGSDNFTHYLISAVREFTYVSADQSLVYYQSNTPLTITYDGSSQLGTVSDNLHTDHVNGVFLEWNVFFGQADHYNFNNFTNTNVVDGGGNNTFNVNGSNNHFNLFGAGSNSFTLSDPYNSITGDTAGNNSVDLTGASDNLNFVTNQPNWSHNISKVLLDLGQTLTINTAALQFLASSYMIADTTSNIGFVSGKQFIIDAPDPTGDTATVISTNTWTAGGSINIGGEAHSIYHMGPGPNAVTLFVDNDISQSIPT